MPSFSQASTAKLVTCELDIQRLFQEVVRYADCLVLEGRRSVQDQLIAMAKGNSWVKDPYDSLHVARDPPAGSGLARAADVIHYPVDWNDWKRHYWFGGVVRGIAWKMGIPIRWGGDWDGDQNLMEERKIDLVHFELAPRHVGVLSGQIG